MNIIQAVKYMMRVLIPQITPIAGEGIEVAKEKEGSVISATFPGWLPHGEVYVGNSTNAAWAAGTVVALGASAVADPLEDTLAASIPAAGADGQFAVLSSDAPAGWEALAAVTGLAVARMSAGFTEAFAAPDGLGGLAGAAAGCGPQVRELGLRGAGNHVVRPLLAQPGGRRKASPLGSRP